MREIKFRAWTGDDMVDVSAIIFDEGTKVSPYEPHILDSHNDVHLLKDIELMQYTGLRDKNGTEIYEGDVVEDSKGRGEVLWVQEHCSFLVAVAGGFFRLENGNAEYRLTETEVIGNIHETGIDNNSGF
jgi:uncharacterized phage protein (TIGR01671 family)